MKMINNNRSHRRWKNSYYNNWRSPFCHRAFDSRWSRLFRRMSCDRWNRTRRLSGSVQEGEANRKAPSVSVTGALLTGNFFRGQVVPSRHATNQAGRAAGSDYKNGRDCADMFIRSHKHMWRCAVCLGEKVREIIRSHCTSFFHSGDFCLYTERRSFKRLIFETRCVELQYVYDDGLFA